MMQMRTLTNRSGRRHRRSGSVLVAVLAIIMLLSFLVTRFMNEAVDDLEYRAIFNEPEDLRSFAFSMLEVSLAVVQEVALIDEGKLYAGEQGWGNPLEYAGITIPNGWEVEVNIRDESGKLPLNTMSEELLNALLEEMGFDFGDTRELSSALLDWIDTDETRRLNGAESEDYLDRDPPYRAANGPLQSLDELRLVQGWDEAFFDEDGNPNERFAELASAVSVRSSGRVNLNAAPPLVVTVLSEQDGWAEDYLFDGLEDPYLKEVPEAADTSTTGTEIGLIGITVSVRRGDIPFIIDALVEPMFTTGGGSAQSGQRPGKTSEDEAIKTGATSEQDAMRYPFRILNLSEYSHPPAETGALRYSAVDI